MKQIVVLSGKGGTGKTVVSASLAALSENSVFCDCDVDASNLHLLLNPTVKKEDSFKSGVKAKIDLNKCIRCGQCRNLCTFDAISRDLIINPIRCEGCKLCFRICPVGAISLTENDTGKIYHCTSKYGDMVYAELGIGEENSGKLVAKVKELAKQNAKEKNANFLIVDGPPGVGCPVMASLNEADLVLAVCEPSLSGISDLKRLKELLDKFGIKMAVFINKYDIDLNNTKDIETWCNKENVALLGKLPFMKEVIQSVMNCSVPAEKIDVFKNEIISVWNKIRGLYA